MGTEYHVPKINGRPVINPGPLATDLAAANLTVDFAGLANSLTLPIGFEPGVAWFLMLHDDAMGLDKNGWHNITWLYNAGSPGDTSTLSFSKWLLASARAVTSNVTNEAAFLCEFRDRRELFIQNGGVVEKSYNIPRPRYYNEDWTTNRYWPDTMVPPPEEYPTEPPTPWTWQGVLDDLWSRLPEDLAGECPKLVWKPTHDPYNLCFREWRVWDAIAAVLECCQSTISLSPSGTFSVVLLGAEQESLEGAIGNLQDRLVGDWDGVSEILKVQAPETIRICFPVRGRAEKLTAVSHRWHDRRFHVIDKGSGLDGAEEGTILPVIAPLSAELDLDAYTCLNVSECETAAAALASKVADRIKRIGFSDWQMYHGLHDSVQLGSELHLIRWRDYGDGDGARTEYVTDSSWAVPARVPRVNAEHFNEAHLMAKTCERFGSGGQGEDGVNYPLHNTPDRGDRRIPISYQRYIVDSDGKLMWSDFSDNADADAICISPPGWFPPKVKVELHHDQSWWRVVGWPPILYAKPIEDIPGVEIDCGEGSGGSGGGGGVDEDAECYMPGRGDAIVYIYDVPTRQYCKQKYNNGSYVKIELVNLSCVDATTIVHICHLNRDEEWTIEVFKKATVQKFARVENCILPGAGGHAKIVDVDGKEGETVDVEDPFCWLAAVPGDIVTLTQISSDNSEAPCCEDDDARYAPTSPQGMDQTVHVTACVDCDATGNMRLVKSDGTDSDCLVELTNRTGRPLAPGCLAGEGGSGEASSGEYIEIHSRPGSCEWEATSAPEIPALWQSTLGEDMCGAGEYDIEPPTNVGGCLPAGFTPPTKCTAKTNRYACEGDSVLMQLVFEGCTCKLIVLSVDAHIREVASELKYGKTCETAGSGGESNAITGCDLKLKGLTQLAVETCVCDEETSELDKVTLATKRFVTGAGTAKSCDEGCELPMVGETVCVFPSCDSPEEEEIPGWEMELIEVVTDGQPAVNCAGPPGEATGDGDGTCASPGPFSAMISDPLPTGCVSVSIQVYPTNGTGDLAGITLPEDAPITGPGPYTPFSYGRPAVPGETYNIAVFYFDQFGALLSGSGVVGTWACPEGGGGGTGTPATGTDERCRVQATRTKICVPKICGTGSPVTLLEGEWQDVLIGAAPLSINCEVGSGGGPPTAPQPEFTAARVCVLKVCDADPVPAWDLETIELPTTFAYDGECITTQTYYVFAWGACQGETRDVFCTEECPPPGSGA